MTSIPITSENIVVITTTLGNHEISAKRRTNMCNHFDKFGIPIWTQYGITDSSLILIEKMYRVHKQRFETFLYKTNTEYGILCDDDFVPHPNFLEELNKTVSLLPENWRCLHLCPGYLWGRGLRNSGQMKEKPCGKLLPERDVDNLFYHDSGRYYHLCGQGMWNGKHIWMGGPIAMLVRRSNQSAEYLYNEYVNMHNHHNNPNDVTLTNILTNNDFICREPQLGWEDECGGSCFLTSIQK